MFRNSTQKIVATIEARMTSSRLPGKVLLSLAGRPALTRMVERVRRSRYVDEIVIATTINSADDPIVKLAEKIGVKCFRGSENDVLKRVLEAAYSVEGDIIVELTGDCPLMDWRLIDRGIEEFFSGDYDYAANIIKRTYPDGFDVQVFPVKVLSQVDKITSDPIDHVHVSCFMYHHPESFRLHNWEPTNPDLNWPDLRLTLDEVDDYLLINTIFKKMLVRNQDFSAAEIVEFLKNSQELLEINKYVRTKNLSEG